MAANIEDIRRRDGRWTVRVRFKPPVNREDLDFDGLYGTIVSRLDGNDQISRLDFPIEGGRHTRPETRTRRANEALSSIVRPQG